MIRVDVTARQPLHIGVQPDAGWLTDTHRFVPGSVLRGALAAYWLAAHRGIDPDTTGDTEFQRIFEGAVRFGPLYPCDDALRPLSVYTCKYPAGQQCRAVAHDAAFDGPAPPTCPECDGPLLASKGTVHGVPEPTGHTRVELDPLERAKGGQLFTRRALPRDTHLTGLVDGDLEGELAWLAAGETGELDVRLGGRRSTSGLATLRCRPEPAPPDFTGWDAQHRRLVVRLLSPGIFVDGTGRPSWLPDLSEIGQLLGMPVTLDAAFARPTVVTGWHAASNLPKPRDFAVAAGSVFVLRFGETPPDHDALKRLWHAGLGLRRPEGNGWVSLQRWTAPPPQPVATRPQPTAADRLCQQLISYRVAALVYEDVRAWAQDRMVHANRSSADAILTKTRYRNLAPAARTAFEAALELDPVAAHELATRLAQWVRNKTSQRSRRTP